MSTGLKLLMGIQGPRLESMRIVLVLLLVLVLCTLHFCRGRVRGRRRVRFEDIFKIYSFLRNAFSMACIHWGG